MAIAKVAETIKSPGAGNGTTTADISTTGANLLVAATSSYYLGTGPLGVQDSLSNTWIPLTSYTASNEALVKLWYCLTPNVGGTHNFSVTGASIYATIAVLAFSGVGILDQSEVGAGNGATSTIQPGSLTPTQANCVVITGVAFNTGTATLTVNGGFTRVTDGSVNFADYSGSTSEGLGMAYLIQGAAAASNPTWTAASAIDMIATQVVFRASGGAVASPVILRRRQLMGIG